MAYRNDSFSREVIEIGAVRVLPDILRKWTSNYVIEEVMLLVKDILESELYGEFMYWMSSWGDI